MKNINLNKRNVYTCPVVVLCLWATTLCAQQYDNERPDPGALEAPAPHWLSNDPAFFKRTIEAIKLLKQNASFPDSYGSFTYSDKGSLGIPTLKLSYPNFEYRKGDANKDFLALATQACFQLDYFANQAGAWGQECKVTEILQQPKRGTLTQDAKSSWVGNYIYTIKTLGSHSVRYILENGAGKKVDVTVDWDNVKFVPEEGSTIESNWNVAEHDLSQRPLANQAA